MASVRRELLEPLVRVADWLFAHRDDGGRLVCEEHRIEHTGKSACAAILAVRLAVHDADSGRDWGALAIEQGRRLVANLTREGTSPCHTFHPGRHDPYNNSNHVIDGGSCSDALAELVLTLGDSLSADDREAFRAASLLHARTYLRYAVLDKGIPAQRAWGLTGLAGAFALEPDPELERAGIEAVGGLEAIQNPDGSFPYHPTEWGAEHVGASDGSSFYHSRVTAFTLFALERMGRDPTDPTFARPLQLGADFVECLQGPDGIKVGLVEAKPWYWGAHYEVVSHPFDAFALARAGRVFGRRELSRAAVRSFRAWAAHLTPEGRPRSHLPAPGLGTSYQCPLFWAAHACWMARALPELEAELAREDAEDARDPGGGSGGRSEGGSVVERGERPAARRSIQLRVKHFPTLELVRLEDDAVVAWVRGRRAGYNVHHGSPHGAGLLRVVRKSDCAELVARRRLRALQEAEWSARRGGPRPLASWAHNGHELRFAWWLTRHQVRTRRPGGPLAEAARVLHRGLWDFASPAVSSSFALDCELDVRDDGVSVRSGLAWAGGAPVPGARTERQFLLDGAGLCVRDELVAKDLPRAVYTVPAAATEVLREPRTGPGVVSYRLA